MLVSDAAGRSLTPGQLARVTRYLAILADFTARLALLPHTPNSWDAPKIARVAGFQQYVPIYRLIERD